MSWSLQLWVARKLKPIGIIPFAKHSPLSQNGHCLLFEIIISVSPLLSTRTLDVIHIYYT